MGTYFWISFFTILIQLMATVKSQQLIESQLNTPSCPGPDPTLNYRPVIGIVSHPGDGASGRLNNGTDVSYIAASYVKFAEMAGARVIPLIYTEPPEILNQSQLNLPSCPGPDPTLNYRPVIGIVSHPGDGASGRLNNGTDVSYIAASYVKFAEMAGARVIPLIYTEPREILNQKLNLVNGVIFTGGRVKDGLYFEVVKGIFQKVLEKNDAGEHFPLLAICLGFELLTMIISKDNNILEEFSAANQASTVQFVENVKLERTVFGRFPSVLIKKMSTDCLVMQNHHFGISPERLQANKDLCSFFRILTTSTDKKNKVYVSTAQARRYPVTALQWHPEKNVFEWRSSQIPHTEDAIQVTQHVANYFVSEARKSSNKPAPSKLLDNLIYNYSPSFAGKAGGSFDEVYLFSPRPTLSSL